jgi:hypothetical protein
VYAYQTAIRCAALAELGEWWRAQLGRAQARAGLLRNLCVELELNPDLESATQKIVRYRAQTTVLTMELSQKFATKDAAQIVAAECIGELESKVQLNWQLLRESVHHASGQLRAVLERACREYLEYDEYFRTAVNWPKELSLQALGLPSEAAGPPSALTPSQRPRASFVTEIRREEARASAAPSDPSGAKLEKLRVSG